MSFLYSTTPALRAAVRSSALRQSPRLFSTTLVQQKSPVDAAKEGLKRSTELSLMLLLPASTKESRSKTKLPQSQAWRPTKPRARPQKSPVKPKERPTSSQARQRAKQKKSRARCRHESRSRPSWHH